MSPREKLLLACTISEWSHAVAHVEAARRTGVIYPEPYTVVGALNRELRDLLNQWASGTERLIRVPEDDSVMVEEALAFATAHEAEIHDLLNGTEGN